ncbi:hypothetical protein FRB96_003415 [Tulasnella sp. 330]|nr:hypothetical protein FRB96_003415 [Tulasnella sp. 330]KAG8882743.1 hypothetical protein FRB97_007782 [Tulasnella sp. 331]
MSVRDTEKLDKALSLLWEIAQERHARHNPNLGQKEQPKKDFEILHDVFEILRLKVQHSILESRRRHNDLQPISRLPPELILKILSFALVDSRLKDYKDLNALSQVLSRWASLIRHTPSFWCTVNSRHSPTTQRNALVRSKPFSIDVIDNSGPPSTKVAFMERVLPHLERWRSLDYYETRDWIFTDLAHAPAPQLESLRITASGALNTHKVPFDGQVPSLRHVHLYGYSIPWECSILRGLKTLHLESLGEMGPSVDQVVGLLRASPKLMKLSLRTLDCDASSEDHHSKVHPVSLPSLKSLAITALIPLAIRDLLAMIRFPNCTELELELGADASDSTELFGSSMNHLAPIVQKIAASEASHSRIEISSNSVGIFGGEMEGNSNKMRLSIIIEGNATDKLVERIAGIFGSADVGAISVVVKAQESDVPLSRIMPILKGDCCIRELKLQSRRKVVLETPNAVLRYLTKPTLVGDIARWRLPDLHALTLKKVSPDFDILVRMITLRHKGKVKNIDVNLVERPAALQLLDLQSARSLTIEQVEQLRSILGEKVVLWKDTRVSGVDTDVHTSGDSDSD